MNELTQNDYNKWLDQIKIYANKEGVNIRTRSAFEDVAWEILQEEGIDVNLRMYPSLQDMFLDILPEHNDPILDTLWQLHKTTCSHYDQK